MRELDHPYDHTFPSKDTPWHSWPRLYSISHHLCQAPLSTGLEHLLYGEWFIVADSQEGSSAFCSNTLSSTLPVPGEDLAACRFLHSLECSQAQTALGVPFQEKQGVGVAEMKNMLSETASQGEAMGQQMQSCLPETVTLGTRCACLSTLTLLRMLYDSQQLP